MKGIIKSLVEDDVAIIQMTCYDDSVDCNQRQSRYIMLKIPYWNNCLFTLAMAELSVNLKPIISPNISESKTLLRNTLKWLALVVFWVKITSHACFKGSRLKLIFH